MSGGETRSQRVTRRLGAVAVGAIAVLLLPTAPAEAVAWAAIANQAPNAPTGLLSDAKPCATGDARPYVKTLTPYLAARHSDPDGNPLLTTSLVYWPLGASRDDAAELSQSAGHGSYVSQAVPAGRLVDGGSYVWQARTFDGSLFGEWSETCEFTVDVVAPPAPAGVSSADYPASTATTPGSGGVGIVGEFTFTPPASGVDDMVGYAWTLDSGTHAAAATQVVTGGPKPATIRYAPTRDSINTMRVWTRDRAGWYSASPVTYEFRVRLAAGPAAVWRFDEAGGDATDASGHGNVATLDGAATRTPGRSGVGTALALDGSGAAATHAGAVTVPDPYSGEVAPVRTDGSLTVSAWARLDGPGGAGTRTVVAANGSRTAAYALGYSGTDARWTFTMADSDTDDPQTTTVRSDAAPVSGRWTHLAATYNHSTGAVTLYVNGVAQAATTTAPGAFDATGSVTIGKQTRAAVDAGFFSGAVDDVKVYGYPVAAESIGVDALPLRPAISFPDGTSAPVGQNITIRFDAGGDTNVTSYRYSVRGMSLDLTATPAIPGGPVTVSVPASPRGTVSVYAVAVDTLGRRSTVSMASFAAVGTSTMKIFAYDGDTGEMVEGTVVTVAPGGLTATTDIAGYAAFPAIAPGAYTVTGVAGDRCGTAETQIEAYDVSVYLALTTDPAAPCHG